MGHPVAAFFYFKAKCQSTFEMLQGRLLSIELGTLIDTIVQQLMLWKSRVIIGFATTTVPYSGLPQSWM